VNTLARVVSYVFHPLLIPTYLFLLFAVVFPLGLEPIPSQSHNVFLILIFIVTFVLPILNAAILKAFGMISSFTMEDRKERVFPFILVSLIYVCITYLLYWKSRIDVTDNFLKLMIIIDMLVVGATLITFFYKVSIHSLAMWGVIGILIPLHKINDAGTLFYPAVVSVILAGIVMSSRLALGAHTLKEVLWGSVVGLALSITGMLIFF
jgi:membrane-associated phospholipid phosphatase